MALDKDEFERLKDLFRTRSEECEGCPFLIEYAERKSWLHGEEGMVMCGLLGGTEGDPEEVCKLTKSEAYNEDDF